MPVPAPTPETRWRCTLCGNLTRFDVQRWTRAREYVHVSLAGEPAVEEREELAGAVEHVTCRWCGRVDAVELVDRPGVSVGSVGVPVGSVGVPVGSVRAAAGSVHEAAGSVPAPVES